MPKKQVCDTDVVMFMSQAFPLLSMTPGFRHSPADNSWLPPEQSHTRAGGAAPSRTWAYPQVLPVKLWESPSKNSKNHWKTMNIPAASPGSLPAK